MSISQIPPRPAVKQPAHIRLATWLRRRGPGFARWFVLLFIASLVIPALTKQWNDRKQELQVKEALLTEISTDSADAVYGAVEASRKPKETLQVARAATVGKWLRDRAAIEPRFDVYFEQSDAAEHWYGHRRPAFRNAVLIYLHLACCDAVSRANHLVALQRYLKAAGVQEQDSDAENWRVLACGPYESCPTARSYTDKYRWLGNQLLAQRRQLLDQLLAANGRGFSTGWRDFVTDLNPLG